MNANDTVFDRFVATHEPHYFAAQQRGFTLIREIEQHLREATSYAGRYAGYVDPETEELVITGDYSEECDAAMERARDTARMVARSNGYHILRAQGRSDEAAQLVYEERYLDSYDPEAGRDDAWSMFDD